MLEKVIRYSFALVGLLTGLTVMRTLFIHYGLDMSSITGIGAIVIVSVSFATMLFAIAGKLIDIISVSVEKVERVLHSLTLYELMLAALGLIVGLIVANLVSISIHRIDIIGVPLAILINVLFGTSGVFLILSKKNENLLESFQNKNASKICGDVKPKLLDTSVIIDGRILDICRSGFLEGDIIIPDFILEELRHLADSPNDLIRCRGRRGFDILKAINELDYPIRIEKIKKDRYVEVDEQLMNYAKEIGAAIVTNDYNMNKVAGIKGIAVLNINDLSNALKPLAVTGDELIVKIIKDGKEDGQGVGYLDDGTMIVVDGGRRYRGEEIKVTVSSVLQTSAGRMIFAKTKPGKITVIK